jgi:hypothetical protein
MKWGREVSTSVEEDEGGGPGSWMDGCDVICQRAWAGLAVLSLLGLNRPGVGSAKNRSRPCFVFL